MNRRLRASYKSSSSPSKTESFHKYLKPGALAQIRDSRISARTHRVNSLYWLSSSQMSLHRTTPQPSPSSSNDGQQPTVNAMESIPYFAARIYGPRCPQRKKLVAAKSVLFLNPSPVPDAPDPIVDAFSNDLLVAH
ncbi:hypothetical protein CJ030_MR8G005349 [Morella rubra]|uniref:Uncharacterized protein n=1 Tax=Morella rubra TaxID=262757 RepID=A0A6A1UQA3_9ROSI|nr:hypothetical protein CJ030_MR8G005349 [Morella rubra]